MQDHTYATNSCHCLHQNGFRERLLARPTQKQEISSFIEASMRLMGYVDHRCGDDVQTVEYDALQPEDWLLLLEAMIHAVAESEVFREFIQDDGPDSMSDLLPRGECFGVDASGAVYYRLGSRAGRPTLSHQFLESERRQYSYAVHAYDDLIEVYLWSRWF